MFERLRVPALVNAALGLLAVGMLVMGLAIAPEGDVAAPAERIVGETEMVRFTTPDGESVELLTRIDTGASSSSIDEEVAEGLGLDLDDAPTVRVRSSLGEEERPVVGLGVQVAGSTSPGRFSVSDRSELGEKALLGRDQLDGFAVTIGQSLLTQPGAQRAPSATEAMLLQVAALAPTTLVALLPFCALLIVLLRVVVGLQTLGTFGPVLLAIGFVQSGLVVGVVLTLGLLALGMLTQVVLGPAKLPRVARLGILVGLVAAVLAGLQASSSTVGTLASWGAALPVVVTATVVERLWESWDADGFRAAAIDGAVTLAVAVGVAGLMLSPPVRYLAEVVPIAFATACVLWTWVAGSYKGLRVTELLRFRGATATPQVPAGSAS
jgi:hypothetical protein